MCDCGSNLSKFQFVSVVLDFVPLHYYGWQEHGGGFVVQQSLNIWQMSYLVEVLEAHNSCTVLRSEETYVKSYRREVSQLSLWQNILQCLYIVVLYCIWQFILRK